MSSLSPVSGVSIGEESTLIILNVQVEAQHAIRIWNISRVVFFTGILQESTETAYVLYSNSKPFIRRRETIDSVPCPAKTTDCIKIGESEFLSIAIQKSLRFPFFFDV